MATSTLPSPKNPNLVILAGELAALVPAMALDSLTNNEHLIRIRLEESLGPQAITSVHPFPPRDRCMIAPRVTVSERDHTIWCPKCGVEVSRQSYAEAYKLWLEHCQ
jgi:hypothetical protein